MGCFNPRRGDVDLLFVTQRGRSRNKRDLTRTPAGAIGRSSTRTQFLTLVQLHLTVSTPTITTTASWRERMARALANDDWRR
jgi:hypothetical protein